jgi:2-amino-4-hydroxy-6-hydroxymethyldihydropteridine diphosphokinase
MTRYAIGLGSNQGDRLQHMLEGFRLLKDAGRIVAVSYLYETEAVGGPEQASYLNAIAVIESDLEPLDLLEALHGIEAARDRLRNVRWGPRTLDLDIVSSDGDSVTTEELTIPHVRSAERRFVLQPLVDVWASAPVAGGVTAGEALDRVADQEVELVARHWAGEPD